MGDGRTQLETVIQTAIDSALKEVHTCLPAVVTRVDSTDQLIDAQITIKRKLAGKLVLLPLLVNVPIRYWRSKTYSITFPIEVGDHVKITIAERSIDTWLSYGGIQDPFDVRKFSLSDAFAEPCMYPQTDLIPDFDPSNLEIKTNSGNTKIIVKAEGVEIITTGATDITSSKTTINNDVEIIGALHTTQAITSDVSMSAPQITGGGVTSTGNTISGGTITAVGEITSGSIGLTSHVHEQGNDGAGDSEQDTEVPK